MRKINCDEILNRSDFPKLNDKDFSEQVKNFCLNKLLEYDVEPSKLDNFREYPTKKYEIFKIDIGNEKIFLLETDLINYEDELDERELYYSKSIAKEICENLKRICEDATFGIQNLEIKYVDAINEIKEKIKELKKLDEDQYNLDRFIYNSLSDTTILEDYEEIEKSRNNLAEENARLKSQLKKSEKTIIELSNKLKISLDDIEESRKKLNLKNKSKFEKIINKLKEILN